MCVFVCFGRGGADICNLREGHKGEIKTIKVHIHVKGGHSRISMLDVIRVKGVNTYLV